MKELRNSEKLYDRYADAATALVMDQYVSALAEALAAEDHASVEISEELDGRCRKLIKKGYAKQLRRSVGKKLLHGTSVAVIVFLVLCGVFAVLFSTVEAIRVPIVNFFTEKQEEAPESSDDSPEARAKESGRNYLEGLLPADYALTEFMDQDGTLEVSYENAAGETVCFHILPKTEAPEPANDEAAAETVTIAGCSAALTTENGCQQIVWFRDGEEFACRLEATAVSREEFIALAEAIEIRRGGPLPAESDDDLAAPAPPERKPAVFDYVFKSPSSGKLHVDINQIDINSVDIEDVVGGNITVPGLDATLIETGAQFVWGSNDGEETGDTSAGWPVLP